jgi:hypothetical protein
MGFRFRRSVRLFPGLRLNLSRSGVSASVGGRGAWLTLGPRGARATVGIPGTGLSYSGQSAWARPQPQVQTSAPPAVPGIEVAELPLVDEIEVPPVLPPGTPNAEPATREAVTTSGVAANVRVDEEETEDPRLLPIALAIIGIIAIAALAWALLV